MGAESRGRVGLKGQTEQEPREHSSEGLEEWEGAGPQERRRRCEEAVVQPHEAYNMCPGLSGNELIGMRAESSGSWGQLRSQMLRCREESGR